MKSPLNAELLVRHMAAGFLLVDSEWVVRLANPKASTLLRRSVADIEGGALWDAFPGLGGTPAEQQLRIVPQGRVERRFEFFSPSLYNWFEIWAIPAPGPALYVYFIDVSDRARLMRTEAVQESVRQILHQAPVAISITRGPEHRYELTNAAARALVGGRALEGVLARRALPEVDPALFDILDRVYESGTPLTLHDLEVTYDREGDGTLYTGTFDVMYQPMRASDGNVEGIIQIAVETTRAERPS